MVQTTKKSLTKKSQVAVLRMFKGTKTRKGIKDARTIGEQLNIPRRSIMKFLNEHGFSNYSTGSMA